MNESMDKASKIFLAGHNGMVGSAIQRALISAGFTNLLSKNRTQLNLENQSEVDSFFRTEKPDIVVNAAARVGGILANSISPYPFLMDNLKIQNNLIDAAHRYGVQKFIFLGSSCIYPKMSSQPIKEEYLLTGPLEPTNQWYAIAKIAGLKACEAIRNQYNKDFLSLMPTNLYGPFDNFDVESSHVLPAMIRKFHDAKMDNHRPVILWGSGKPQREFLHVDDMAQGVLLALTNKLPEYLYNLGYGSDISIKDLADLVQKVVGHKGEMVWDKTKPDGTPRKLMDSSKLYGMGFSPKIDLKTGIASTYQWFLENENSLRKLELNTD